MKAAPTRNKHRSLFEKERFVETYDLVMLWIIAAGALAAAWMRRKLAEKQGRPYPPFWAAQSLLLPLGLVVALVLYMTGIADIILPAIVVLLAQELIFGLIRRKTEKQNTES